MPKLQVEFDIRGDVSTFEEQLRLWSETKAGDTISGYRTDGDTGGLRPALFDFAVEMERKLRKNDHKTGWRTYPIAALLKLLRIEYNELDVAVEFGIGDAPNECIDIANFAMMTRDRLLNPPKKPDYNAGKDPATQPLDFGPRLKSNETVGVGGIIS